jgi:hypothetical protein
MATAPQPIPIRDPRKEKAQAAFLKIKAQHGMFIGGELHQAVQNMPARKELVAGMLSARSVNILVGDSGIGKTPLVHQLALAVAAGIPFLGASTRRARVLLVDFENPIDHADRILEQQRLHLGLDDYPTPSFLFWSADNAAPQATVWTTIRNMAPDLLIIDSLRSFCPTVETGNAAAATEIKRLRTLAKQAGTCVLLVHHVRKNASTAPLEDERPLDWLRSASGARALINQSDARLALAPYQDGLILRGQRRTLGEIGPYYLRRCLDAGRQSLGYELSEPPPPASALRNPEHEAAFARLPPTFSTKEARAAFGKGCAASNSFLNKMIAAGLAKKTGWGVYKKVDNPDNPSKTS